MPVIVLGILDAPYASEQKGEKPKKGGRKRTVGKHKDDIPAEFVTTGQVAEWLERKYKIYETFYKVYKQRIEVEAIGCLERQILNLSIGAPVGDEAATFAELEDQIRIWFMDWLNADGPAEAGIPGTPTKAAVQGIRHGYKHPYSKENGPRVSFVDTGLYRTSFRVWTE